MNTRRFNQILSILIALISVLATQSHAEYYYGLGQQPLTVTDSIVCVKFDTSVPSQYIETFAFDIDALDTAKRYYVLWRGWEVFSG